MWLAQQRTVVSDKLLVSLSGLLPPTLTSRISHRICTNYGSGPGRPGGSSCSICSILATPLITGDSTHWGWEPSTCHVDGPAHQRRQVAFRKIRGFICWAQCWGQRIISCSCIHHNNYNSKIIQYVLPGIYFYNHHSSMTKNKNRHNRGSCDDTADMTGLMHLSTRSQFLYVVVGEQPFTATQPTTPPAWRVYSNKTTLFTNVMYTVSTKITLFP